jgi:hypothetical protein
VVSLDFFADGRHLVIDVVVTTVYKNIVLHQVANILGYAAKQAEDIKFLANRTSRQPIALRMARGHHVLVPFAIEDGGRLGAHAQALLRTLATTALAHKGKTPPVARRTTDAPQPMMVSQ